MGRPNTQRLLAVEKEVLRGTSWRLQPVGRALGRAPKAVAVEWAIPLPEERAARLTPPPLYHRPELGPPLPQYVARTPNDGHRLSVGGVGLWKAGAPAFHSPTSVAQSSLGCTALSMA